VKPVLVSLVVVAVAVPTWAAQQAVTLSIPAMNCAACPITVKKALTRLDGVLGVRSDLSRRETTVVFDDARVDPSAITQATEQAGFRSTVVRGKP
jgi:periplasmic mercuric ion binding protein